MEYAPAPFHIAAVCALHLSECKLPGLCTPQMSLSIVWLGSAETQEAFIAIILSWLMPNMNSSSRDQKKNIHLKVPFTMLRTAAKRSLPKGWEGLKIVNINVCMGKKS